MTITDFVELSVGGFDQGQMFLLFVGIIVVVIGAFDVFDNGAWHEEMTGCKEDGIIDGGGIVLTIAAMAS